MNKLISQMFDDIFPMSNVETKNTFNRQRIPVNIINEDHQYTIQLVVPGIKKEDISIEVEDLTLTVAYQADTEKEQDTNLNISKREYLRYDFSPRSFKKSFNLGETINTDELKAQFENGILNIFLAKRTPAQPVKKQLVIE